MDYDRVFARQHGWTGADGTYSVRLADGKTLWLFSDTLVGDVDDKGRRHLSEKVPINKLAVRALHNSAAIQSGPDAQSIRFVVPGGLESPRNLFDPPDGQGWFWVSGAVANADGSATVLLNQFVKTDDPRLPYGKQKAVWASNVHIDGTEVIASTPRRIDVLKASPGTETVFGAAVMKDGPWTYVYGARGIAQKQMVVARVPNGKLADSNAYQFYDGKQWVKDLEHARPLPVQVMNEFSVHKDSCGKYVLVSDEFSSCVFVRTADSPEGPWSDPKVVWKPPEAKDTVVTYNAKAHPELSGSNGLLVSYNVNSLNEEQSLYEADVYRPRFIWLK
jgi:hypothetical protein